MRTVFLQRVLALGAAALLGAVLALALSDRGEGAAPTTVPQPAVGPGAGWYAAQAGVARLRRDGATPTHCGWVLGPRSLGIVHPVLPCGAKVFVAYRGRRALTQVVDRGPVPQGRAFDLTPSLAKLLHLDGVRSVRWAFARS